MLRVPDEQRRFHRGAAYSGSLGVGEAEESRQCGGPCADTERPLALAGREEALLRAGAGPEGMSDIYVSTREKQRSQSEDDEDGGKDEERDDD
jgi:hypothetical protein